MNGIIIFVGTIFLIGAQASYISTDEQGWGENEDSQEDEILSTLIELEAGTDVNRHRAADISETFGELEEIQKMKTFDNELNFLQNYKDLMGCNGDSCEWCLSKVCIQVIFLSASNEFQFCATYKGSSVFCKTFPARNFKYCKKISVKLFSTTVCLEVKNIYISGGEACMDVTVSASGLSKTYRNVCIGTSRLQNTTTFV